MRSDPGIFNFVKWLRVTRPWRVSTKWTTRASPARCTRAATRTCCCAPPGILRWEDAAAAAEPGADATTALWSENAGAHRAGATLSTDFEIQNVRVLASQVVLDSALVESDNRALLSGRPLVPNGMAEHNVTVARAFTKLMGAFVTFWDNDAGSNIHLLANPGQDVAPIGAAKQEDTS